jgi:hypothetical protein
LSRMKRGSKQVKRSIRSTSKRACSRARTLGSGCTKRDAQVRRAWPPLPGTPAPHLDRRTRRAGSATPTPATSGERIHRRDGGPGS